MFANSIVLSSSKKEKKEMYDWELKWIVREIYSKCVYSALVCTTCK